MDIPVSDVVGRPRQGLLEWSSEMDKIFAALAKAQGETLVAVFNAENDAFKRSGKATPYANLTAIWEAVRKALPKNGIAVIQAPTTNGPEVTVTTVLGHESGQWLRSSISARAVDASPQKIASCVTYLRRYGLSSMTGVVGDKDDDGNEAQGATVADDRPSDRRQDARQREAAPPQAEEDPALEAAKEKFDRIRAALAKAGSVEEIEEIWSSNARGLARIEELRPSAHTLLVEARNRALARVEPAPDEGDER